MLHRNGAAGLDCALDACADRVDRDRFDAAAALLGFTRETTFEGQAAMWLEQSARRAKSENAYRFPIDAGTLDFRPLLEDLIEDRVRGREPAAIARAFQLGIAEGISAAIKRLCREHATTVCVLSGGVFQNELLNEDLNKSMQDYGIQLWTNSAVPPNDGGISLGQAAMAAFHTGHPAHA